MHIESIQNGRVKDVVKLRDRRHRDKTGRFIIEGYRELLRAVNAGFEVETVYFCPSLFLGENEFNLINNLRAEAVECTEEPFRKMSYRDRPDGLLAVAPQFHHPLPRLEKADPLFIVAEAIEKPGNLGTILRSADATGVDGVIICDRCTDLFNPNVVRASVGTLFTVPVYEASSDEALLWIKESGIQLLAATPAAQSLYCEVNLTGPLAIAVGTEQLGLSERWLNEADIPVRIPMHGVADSLNVATATTVLLYEAIRQRS